MKVVVPIANSGVVRAVQTFVLEQNELHPRYVPVGAGDEYEQLFRELWSEGEAFTIIEHDILPWPGAVESLEACGEPWCGFGYHLGGRVRRPWLGCTKFEPRRLGPVPLRDDWRSPGNGRGLDHEIESNLAHRSTDTHEWAEGHDLICHEHRPAVIHLQKYTRRIQNG